MFKKIFSSFTSHERRAFLVTAGVFVAAGAALAGIIFATKTSVVPAIGGEYSEGFVGQPSFVNPVLAASEIDRSLVRLLFAPLSTLSDKVDMSDQGRVWNVRLKEGLLWSDGHKLTSDDVVFTVQKIQDAEHRSPLAPSWQGVAVNRLSELEVQFTLGTAYTSFAENINALPPVPKHLFAEVPAANWRLSDYNLKPIGSGPYTFKNYEKQTNGFLASYSLEANSRYAGDAPFIASLKALFFPNDEELLSAMNGGAVDGMALRDATELSRIKRPYQQISFRLPNYYAVFLNQSQNAAFKDLAVRKALALSAPKQGIIERVFQGGARAVSGPLPPDVFPTANAPLPSGTENVAPLLEGAGWNLNSEGVREKQIKNGKILLEFTINVPEIPFLVRTAEELSLAWKAIGAKVAVAVVPSGEEMNNIIRNRSYQSVLFGNVLNPPFDLYPFWNSGERFYPGLNLSLYNNKKVDALLLNVRKAANEDDRRKNALEAARLIAEDMPAIFLYSPDYIYLANKDLQGISPSLIREPADRFLEVNKWYLETKRAWEE